jgi:hypothetical protein
MIKFTPGKIVNDGPWPMYDNGFEYGGFVCTVSPTGTFQFAETDRPGKPPCSTADSLSTLINLLKQAEAMGQTRKPKGQKEPDLRKLVEGIMFYEKTGTATPERLLTLFESCR